VVNILILFGFPYEEYIHILLPSLFVANIAAITLIGQFFKQIDDFVLNYFHLNKDICDALGRAGSVFVNNDIDSILPNELRPSSLASIEKKNVKRTILLTAIFLISECILIVPYLICQINLFINPNYDLQMCNDVYFDGWLEVCVVLSLFFFVIGICSMMGLLVKKYYNLRKYDCDIIDATDVESRMRKIASSP